MIQPDSVHVSKHTSQAMGRTNLNHLNAQFHVDVEQYRAPAIMRHTRLNLPYPGAAPRLEHFVLKT